MDGYHLKWWEVEKYSNGGKNFYIVINANEEEEENIFKAIATITIAFAIANISWC